MAQLRQLEHHVTAMNQIWSMDFVANALFDGGRLAALTVVDNYVLASLAVEADQSLKGDDVEYAQPHCNPAGLTRHHQGG